MKQLEPLSSDAEGTAITGLRPAAPRVAAEVDLVAAEVDLSSDRAEPVSGAPPELWDADDATESELPVPVGELLGGKYVVERMFAEGGMGIVCLGRHAQLDQPVAIKFLRRALSGRPSVVQRFLNEARALAALRSEHVVRVIDVGQLESGRPYLVMEHLDGIDLEALIDRDGRLSVETAVSYVLQVAEALSEAHALGIVHRDIKPENLFLWSGGPGKDIVKVLDFGLAKRLGGAPALGATGPQDSMGSPCYMSPEQIVTPQLVDSRTDVWSLGVVLYRLLTDSLPFDGANVTEVFGHVLNAAPRSLREVLPTLDGELDAIVHRCLEKSPSERYATISDLSDELEGYLVRRREGRLSRALPFVPAPSSAAAPATFVDDTKIRIPGVHARWPGVLLAFAILASAGVYQADRTGRVRVRDFVERWVAPPRLGADLPGVLSRRTYEPPIEVALGVFARDPVMGANGTSTIRAEPERELAVVEPSGEAEPLSDAERARRQAAYREFLSSHGLTPLRDVLPTIDGLSPDDRSDRQ